MKITESIKKKMASRRERKAKEKFIKTFKTTFPDAFDFIGNLKRMEVEGCSMPCFVLSADFLAKGFVSACNSAGSIARDIVAREIDEALQERSHRVDISRVGVNGFQENGNFVLQIRFRNLPSADKNTDGIAQIE